MTGKPEPAVRYSLSIDAENRTIEDIVTEFSTTIPTSLLNEFCSGLVTLLENTPTFLKPTERLVAFALLHHSYASKSSDNPYVSFLVNFGNDAKTDTYEKSFIRHLLGGAHEVLKLSAADYINRFDSASNSFPPLGPLAKQPDPFTRFFKNTLPDPDIGSGEETETVTGLIQTSSLDTLYTHWTRTGPARLLVLEGEIIRVNPDKTHDPYWDLGSNVDTSFGATIRDLILQALSGPLAVPQQKRFLLELSSNPGLVHHCGLTAGVLVRLVETNPLIAVEVLIKLMYTREMSDYLMVLVNMDLSLRSMEVVNRLTTEVNLPAEFVNMYISHCISSCENTKDEYMQCRLVRLVCVFLQSLIKNDVINVQNIFIEVQAFCVEFSKIREAAGLLRLLKTLE